MASDETPELLDEIWWNSVSEPSDVHLDLLRLRLGDEQAKSWILAPAPVIPQCLRNEEEVFRSCWKRWRPRALAANPHLELEILNKTPIVAGMNELVINPRARSAKLRAARKI